MKQMSEYVNKLEGYADLEVSIIRATKINKVLKAILKMNAIPKEEEFQFKSRSQSLLDKWNKLLASEPAPPASAEITANGTSEESKTHIETENGATENDEKIEEKSPVLETPLTALPKDEIADNEEPAPVLEEPTKVGESLLTSSHALY